MTTTKTTTTPLGLKLKPWPLSAPQSNLTARVVQRIRRRTKPDRLVENFIFGFFRHGAQAALYVTAAYAAKIAFGIGHLAFP
jgi:hypothetical protein